jgi:small nuclear ribonucleoprotein (snRNP)-like protein
VLGDAPAWLWLAVLVTPGWFAVRGWHVGREEPLSTSLTEWLPLALAISATWSGILTLACAARAAAIAASSPTAVRIAAWLAVAGVLWLVPFGLGWLAGRISRKRSGRPVTVVLKSGATIAGTLHHATATEFVLADATVEARRYALVTINRCDAELVLSGQRVAVAQPSDDQQSVAPLVVAPQPHDDRPPGIATARAGPVVPPPARRPSP